LEVFANRKFESANLGHFQPFAGYMRWKTLCELHGINSYLWPTNH